MHFLGYLFPLTYLAILILSLFLFRLIKKDITKPSILTIVYVFYLVFAYLGIPLLYYKSIPYYVDLKITSKTTIWLMLLLSGSSLIFLLLGALVARLIIEPEHLEREKKREMPKASPLVLPLFLFLLSVIVLFIYLRSLEAIPLIEAFKGVGKEDVSLLRFEATAGSGLKYNWISFFVHQAMPFLSFYFFARYLLKKNKFGLLILFLSLPLTFFAQLVEAQKAPPALFLIGLFLVAWYLERIKLSFKQVILLSLATLLILATFYSIFMPSSNVLNNFLNPVRRAMVSQIASSYFYFEFFPKEKPFLLGRSFPNPRGIFPYENYPLAVEIMDFLNPTLAPKGQSGSANTVFWAEIYANFGIWPIPFISLLLGSAIYLIENYFERKKLNPLKVALFAWFALFLSRLSLTSLSTLILTPSLSGIILLSLSLWIYSSLKSILFKRAIIFYE